jgi:hypothetical protein
VRVVIGAVMIDRSLATRRIRAFASYIDVSRA